MDDIRFLLSVIIIFQFVTWAENSRMFARVSGQLAFLKGSAWNKLKKWKRNR